jgi:uncharacterized protein GlcG (DUF336 family)
MEAQARRSPATIAVVDRLGNVLAVYAMTGAPAVQAIPRARDGTTRDLQGVDAPASLAAISKAVTGAYLSSSGNAFSSRTASMIVQEHFPPSPATAGLEAGPLFGVQFSQLACSDLVRRFRSGTAPGPGPRPAPLGLAADPGGFPLYKNGVVVGGVGVAADDVYGFDPNVADRDSNADEAIAFAASSGFQAPESIRADQISVDGVLLRFSDVARQDLLIAPDAAPGLPTPPADAGGFISVRGYFDAGRALAGVAYGAAASGVRPAGAAFNNADAYVVSDPEGAQRFPLRAGAEAVAPAEPLSLTEVRAVLEEAFSVMSSTRAQIRRPLNSRAEVTISLVDARGGVLGVVRSPDAPIFGIDVSLQKARSAALFSAPWAGQDLLATARSPALAPGAANAAAAAGVTRLREALGDPSALSGSHAFTSRAIGVVARPLFPDGQIGADPGPLSIGLASWSAFATGLQSALITDNVVEHVLSVATGSPDTAAQCTFMPKGPGGAPALANGLQIFPGSAPIYRGDQLVGAIGVSGDGIDQDDMIAFLGVARASRRLNGSIGNAPSARRSDLLFIRGVRLRYINCPFAPFVDSSEQNVCQGL